MTLGRWFRQEGTAWLVEQATGDAERVMEGDGHVDLAPAFKFPFPELESHARRLATQRARRARKRAERLAQGGITV